MARQVVPLTDPKCRQAKFSPAGGNKLFDGGGLFLELLRSGAKKWRVRYRSPITGKESMLTIGDYPAVPLARARAERARIISATSMVFQYAVGTGRAPADPTQGLKKFLDPRAPVKHFPHVSEASLGTLIARVKNYHGRPETRIAIQIMMHTFPRTNELRWAAWGEFSRADALWLIPAGRMKGTRIAKETGADHTIPLSRQVLALLQELAQYTGRYRLLFPGLRDPANTPMSAETINKAPKILGFEGEQTGHGFRGLASTIMNERSGTRPEVIERQLAHKERNMVRRAYNHAEYLDERRQLMQWWSDYLDRCAAKAEK